MGNSSDDCSTPNALSATMVPKTYSNLKWTKFKFDALSHQMAKISNVQALENSKLIHHNSDHLPNENLNRC